MSSMLPDAGAGAPLTHTWWLVVLCLILGSFMAQLAMDGLRKLFRIKEKADDSQAATIATLQQDIHACQLRCAQHRQEMMNVHLRRDDFQQFTDRIETAIDRLHERMDQIAQKMLGDK